MPKKFFDWYIYLYVTIQDGKKKTLKAHMGEENEYQCLTKIWTQNLLQL